MTDSHQTLVVGIGSHSGDDQAGWRVVDLVSDQLNSDPSFGDCRLIRAKVPHELLDVLDGVQTLHIIDACEIVGHSDASMDRFEVARDDDSIQFCASNTNVLAVEVPKLRSSSTHHMDLVSVLRLARQLQKLPQDVVLWTIPGQRFSPQSGFDPECESHMQQCAGRIAEEIARA